MRWRPHAPTRQSSRPLSTSVLFSSTINPWPTHPAASPDSPPLLAPPCLLPPPYQALPTPPVTPHYTPWLHPSATANSPRLIPHPIPLNPQSRACSLHSTLITPLRNNTRCEPCRRGGELWEHWMRLIECKKWLHGCAWLKRTEKVRGQESVSCVNHTSSPSFCITLLHKSQRRSVPLCSSHTRITAHEVWYPQTQISYGSMWRRWRTLAGSALSLSSNGLHEQTGWTPPHIRVTTVRNLVWLRLSGPTGWPIYSFIVTIKLRNRNAFFSDAATQPHS